MNHSKENWGLDGSSISFETFDYMKGILPKGSVVLELGSGKGTEKLSSLYKMYSIEHNSKFLDLYKSEYIYAPLKKMELPDFPEENYWYDPYFFEDKIKKIDYNFILVDGPIGGSQGGRSGFYYNYNLFKRVPFIIDDLHRPAERRMFDLFVERYKPRGSEIISYEFDNRKCYFGYIEM